MFLKVNQLKLSGVILILFITSNFSMPEFCFSQAGTSLGIKAGAGLSRYFFIVAADQVPIYQNFVPVYQTGLIFNQLNKKNVGVQIELDYTQKAWEQTTGESGKYKVVIDNIEFPFLTHFRIGKKKSAWIINAGLHFTHAFNARVDSSGITNGSIIEYAALKYSKFDYGLDGGLGYEIGKDNGIFLIQIMYTQGMKNIIERDPNKVYRSLNQSVFMSCIYKIPLSKKIAKKK